jgi:hypothetical protein
MANQGIAIGIKLSTCSAANYNISTPCTKGARRITADHNVVSTRRKSYASASTDKHVATASNSGATGITTDKDTLYSNGSETSIAAEHRIATSIICATFDNASSGRSCVNNRVDRILPADGIASGGNKNLANCTSRSRTVKDTCTRSNVTVAATGQPHVSVRETNDELTRASGDGSLNIRSNYNILTTGSRIFPSIGANKDRTGTSGNTTGRSTDGNV